MERDEALNSYLQGLREGAGLSVAEVCERTKIQARFVEALEAGRYGEVPSNTHLRAFSLAIAQACGGDAERCAMQVRRVLAASAPLAPASSFDMPAPAPIEALKPLKEAERPQAQAGGGNPVLAADGPMAIATEEPSHGLAAASSRLRSLPLTLLLALLGLAGALSYGTHWGLEQWRRSRALQLAQSPAAETDAAPAAAAAAAEPAKAKAVAPSAPATEAKAATDAPAAAESVDLSIRARRACWLVLELDGERLPTITMQDGDKLHWPVAKKARLLAGNVGALRIWWMHDNWGYLGELGQRANALVFEPGKAPKLDKSQALALPPGVPE